MLRVVSIVALAAAFVACGASSVTSPSAPAAGSSSAGAPCEWTHEYDRLPPGTTMGGPRAAADGGASVAPGDGG